MAEDLQADRITFYFQKAIEDHVDINLMIFMDMCQFSSFRAPCVMIKNRHFVMRVPLQTVKEKQIIWGADVNGYFSLRLDDKETIHFKSKLVRIYNAPPDSLFLVMPLPKQLDHSQRRNSRRVDIGQDDADNFGVWYGSLEGGNENELPQQIWRPFNESGCFLGELSASGMRLDFSADNPLMRLLTIDTPVLLKGNFGSATRPQSIFILGAVVRKMPRKDKEGLMSVGCHFTSWRKINGIENESWFKADEMEGIAIVSQWLMRNFRGSSSLGHIQSGKE